MDYQFYYTMEYLPTRYEASSQEWRNRRAVWNFKDGECSDEIIEKLAEYIRKIIREQSGPFSYSESDFVICFIPASTRTKTIRRFSTVAKRLSQKTGVRATLSAITKETDSESEHVSGKSSNPTKDFSFKPDEFRGKTVILIDDVITRGRTFTQTANKMMAVGADNVIGLFVARTINPDWNAMIA